MLGGEQSGHIIQMGHATTGDGVLTGLHLLAAVNSIGVPVSAAAKVMTRYPQVLINVRGNKDRAMADPALADAVSAAEVRARRHGPSAAAAERHRAGHPGDGRDAAQSTWPSGSRGNWPTRFAWRCHDRRRRHRRRRHRPLRAGAAADANVWPSGCSPRENAAFRRVRWRRVSRPRRPWRRRSARRAAWCGQTPRSSPAPDGRPSCRVYGTVAAAAAARLGVTAGTCRSATTAAWRPLSSSPKSGRD